MNRGFPSLESGRIQSKSGKPYAFFSRRLHKNMVVFVHQLLIEGWRFRPNIRGVLRFQQGKCKCDVVLLTFWRTNRRNARSQWDFLQT